MSAERASSVTLVICLCLSALSTQALASQSDKAVEETAVAKKNQSLSRVRRFVPFPEGSNIVVEIALGLPTGATVGLSQVVLATGLTFNLPTSPILYARKYEQSAADRLYIYNNLESFLSSLGYDGHACTLRTLCEVAEAPFHQDLYGDIINLVLSASRGADGSSEYDEYQLAEYYGKTYGDCGEIYPSCPNSVLDTVSTAF